jgi:Flp pilus assembly pilin Flp
MSGFKNFLLDEEGIGVVEMILIVVVLIGLVVIFKSKLTTLVTNIFSTITDRAGQI